ncbi:MAG: hypothetical protein SGI86_09490 [Deltaproteobacteria bacterium]|nr:hypothetical protein [Deltaproteobacteria bacterium]
MHQSALHRYTLGEYVELEESSTVRHEFLDGSIYAMAGGTPEHAAMAGAGAEIGCACRPCEACDRCMDSVAG